MNKTLAQIAAAALSASFLVSVWEPFRQSGNVWFALVPLLLLARHVSPRRAFWLGWLTGAAAWVGQLWWMLRLADNGGPWPLVVPALVGLSTLLGLFVGAFAACAASLRRAVRPEPGAGRIALVLVAEPALWAGLEYLRATLFGGFAWNPLGLACTDFLPLAQAAALGGAALVSALVVAANGAVATLIERLWGAVTHSGPEGFLPRLRLSLETVLPLAVVLVAFVWGLDRIRAYDALPKDGVATVAAERTEVPCRFLPDAAFESPWETAHERARLLPYLHADLWLWPESAADGIPPNALVTLAKTAETPLLVGHTWAIEPRKPLNAAILITDTPGVPPGHVYGKRHLVPFGEYIPLDKTFPILQSLTPIGVSLYPGDWARATLTLPSGLTVGPLICFEDTVAAVARSAVNQGARVLLNLSNDAWYTPSAQPAQHARQAIFRCIETGVPMFRATNGGHNASIDAVGRPERLPQEPGLSTLRQPLTARPYASLYLRFGDLVFGAPCALFALLVLIRLVGRRLFRGPGATPPEPSQSPAAPAATALSLVLAAGLLVPGPARAQTDLLPVAGMALDDGNVTLAERTAQSLLAKLGISAEERARAREILIRAALAREDWAGALALIETTPELPADRRLALSLAAYNGRRDFAKTQLAYAEAKPSADTPWGVAALRLVLQADLELGKSFEASERFAAVDAAKGADARVRAENALLWCARFPNAQSRAALLRAAGQAILGGVYLDCALALPGAFANAPDRDAAIALLDRLLAQEGLSPTIEARLALAASALGRTASARIAHARRAVSAARDDALRQTALSTLGALLCAQADADEIAEGLDMLNRAVRLAPSAPEAPALQLRIAETLGALGRQDEALAAYDRWLESYDVPDLRIRVRQGRGRLLLALGRADEALASLSEAIELAGDDAAQRRELVLEAVEAALAARRYARAETLCRELLRTDRDPAILLRLARCLEASGDTEGARKTYAEARDAHDANEADAFVAAMRLGAMLAKENRPTEAIAEFSRFLPRAKDPARRDALRLERGRVYYGLDQLARARDDFAAVADSATPALAAEARFFRVLCLYRLGDDEAARTFAESFVAAYPDSPRIPDMVLWLAKSDFNRGDYRAAAEGFRAFAERWPQEPRVATALLLAARAAYQDQDYARAVELVGTLAQRVPQAHNLPDARFLQAEALIELARHGEAAEVLDALVRQNPNAPWIGAAYGRLGDCFFVTATDDPERYALALDAFREAQARLEADADAEAMYAYKIGRVYEKQNRPDDAAEQYTRQLYRALARPNRYGEDGTAWLRKTLARLRAIETARGNQAGYETLRRRIRHAGLLATEP